MGDEESGVVIACELKKVLVLWLLISNFSSCVVLPPLQNSRVDPTADQPSQASRQPLICHQPVPAHSNTDTSPRSEVTVCVFGMIFLNKMLPAFLYGHQDISRNLKLSMKSNACSARGCVIPGELFKKKNFNSTLTRMT